MVLDRIHLKSLLQLFLVKEKLRSTRIRRDALQTMKRRDEGADSGGDFHLTFWRDAKQHASGTHDLRVATVDAIRRAKGRARLYPLLQDGFLLWWNEKRRWIIEPISTLPSQ